MNIVEYSLRKYYKEQLYKLYKTNNQSNTEAANNFRRNLRIHGCNSATVMRLRNHDIWTLKLYNNKSYIYEANLLNKTYIELIEVR